jgi:Rrf2 family protein
MFTLNTETDYALIILSYLYRSRQKNKSTALSELALKTHLPKRYLAKIAAKLVNSKLLVSKEGRVGGYQLTANIDRINLYDFLVSYEGEISKTKCSGESDHCHYQDICRHRHFFTQKLATILKDNLTNVKLKTLFLNQL